MKQYPEIPGSVKAPMGQPCIAFYKYDGSNLRWEWTPKRGWYKFGTRTHLFDATDPLYRQAIPIFQDTMGAEIARRCKDLEQGLQRVIVFTEFFGINSFTGGHVLEDPKRLQLFDVNLYKRGIMPARDFVKNFGDLPYAAQIIYNGNMSQQFVEDVRESRYPVWEGVVAKGDGWMCKIKTKAYLNKLQETYKSEWQKYWE